jgi:hypothetical protein
MNRSDASGIPAHPPAAVLSSWWLLSSAVRGRGGGRPRRARLRFRCSCRLDSSWRAALCGHRTCDGLCDELWNKNV